MIPKKEIMSVQQHRLEKDAIAEVVRQGEIRLSAQLQIRLSLESRATSSVSWLLAFGTVVVGAAYNRREDLNKYVYVTLVLSAISIIIAGFLTLLAIISPLGWQYVGANPSESVSYFVLKEKSQIGHKIANWLRHVSFSIRNVFGRFGYAAFEIQASQTSHLFYKEDTTLDHILHKTALRYAESIVYNDRSLKAVKSSFNFPILFCS